MLDHRYLMNAFDWTAKAKQAACKSLRLFTKNEENFEKLQETFEIFDQNLYGKLTLFTILY